MRFSGLHRKIALRLVLLLIAGMVLIDLAVFTSAQHAMVQDRLAQGRRFLRLWGAAPQSVGRFSGDAAALSGALDIVGLDSNLIPTEGGAREWLVADAALKRRLAQGEDAVIFQGLTWGVFWRQPAQLVIVVPVSGGGEQGTAAAGGIWSLEPLYHKLRQFQVLVGGYMLVNLVLLEMLGIYLFSRVTVRPLQRLVRRAETYSDENELFAAGALEDNDYGRLSHALNRIYGRIQRDRQDLAATVERLKVANQELGRAQQDVQRAEKLAAIGRLSAGLAHEIGNPLGIVTGYLELLGQAGLAEDERSEIVARTETEIARIGRIMRQLLDLARPTPEAAEVFSVHDLIRETARVFECQPLTSGIAITIDPRAGRDRVEADAERLRQVFLNLMINAADAIKAVGPDHSGRLTIETENNDGSIRIDFRDNGAGIAQEHLPLIFDPFFTTKKPGQGTGLGLAVSFMIIEALGGRMTAASQPGLGTTLQVELPLAARDAVQGPGLAGGDRCPSSAC